MQKCNVYMQSERKIVTSSSIYPFSYLSTSRFKFSPYSEAVSRNSTIHKPEHSNRLFSFIWGHRLRDLFPWNLNIKIRDWRFRVIGCADLSGSFWGTGFYIKKKIISYVFVISMLRPYAGPRMVLKTGLPQVYGWIPATQ